MRYADTAIGGIEDSLAAWLQPRLQTAEFVALRTSFLSLQGLRELEDPLSEVLGRGGSIELVTGGANDQADPMALTELLRMSKTAAGALTVRIVTDGVFHNAKTYYVRHEDGRVEAQVGSANLTRSGLHANHEAALVLDSEQDDPGVLDEVLAAVRAYQHGHGAVELDGAVIADIQARQPFRPTATRKPGLGGSTRFGALLQPTVDDIEAIATRPGETAGLPTGFVDLDRVTNGLLRGTLTAVAAQQGVGRTTLALDFCRNLAIGHDIGAAFITAAADERTIMQRVLSAEARVRGDDIRGGRMREDDWTRMARRSSEIADAPLYINSSPSPHLDALSAEITQLREQNDVQLVVIDPLSAVTATTEPGASREREVSVVIRALKALALELDIAMVVTVELGTGPDRREDRRPQLGDLRESSSIAQTADNVLLIYRPDAFERDDPRMGEADLILAKHRAGRASTVTVAHQLHYNRFADLALE